MNTWKFVCTPPTHTHMNKRNEVELGMVVVLVKVTIVEIK